MKVGRSLKAAVLPLLAAVVLLSSSHSSSSSPSIGAAALILRREKKTRTSSVTTSTATAKASSEEDRSTNPVIALYRRWTKQYLRDAEQANAAAQHYAELTKAAIEPIEQETKKEAAAEMQRVGVREWGHATMQFEQLLENKQAANAARAAASASAPFMAAAGKYQQAQLAYDAAAQGYTLRVGADIARARKLQSVANQYALEGQKELAATYGGQAAVLLKQATSFRGMAEQYHGMATRLHNVIPGIQKDAGAAAAYAAYPENPGNAAGPEHAFAFTVAPPYPEAL